MQIVGPWGKNCQEKCVFCNRTGHAKEKCYINPENKSKAKKPGRSKDQKPTFSSKPASKNSKVKNSAKPTAPSKTRQTRSDVEEPSSDIESPGHSSDQNSNRLTHIDSKARRLPMFDPRQLAMGDAPSHSSHPWYPLQEMG